DVATTGISPLSLHDALPISGEKGTVPFLPACAIDDGEGDYLNCPFTTNEYEEFYEALLSAEQAAVHEFDQPKFFEGCLPIEVMRSEEHTSELQSLTNLVCRL